MISFSTLGTRSKLGNHLFQYAFLRSTALRLGVRFYCPRWIGDSAFHLDDSKERSEAPEGIESRYREPRNYTGLNASALGIRDGTEIEGYFQTEKYLDRKCVLSWYRLREDLLADVRRRYGHVDFENCVGLSVRLGDFATTYGDVFFVPRRDYYKRALEMISRNSTIVVFSDDVPRAKTLLGDLGAPTVFMEGYEPYEGIYLQSQCHHFICSPSTYSWWGAWLNTYPDKRIIVPQEGAFRPGAPVRNDEYWPESWVKIRALRSVLDHFALVSRMRLIQRGVRKVVQVGTKALHR